MRLSAVASLTARPSGRVVSTPVRRGSVVQLVLLGTLFGAGAAAVALLIPWMPHSASKQADRIDFVFWFVTAISIAIFALVAAVIVYSLLKFRAGADDDSDGTPVHGHTGLEIVWTAVPAALVTAIAIVSAVVLGENGRFPSASASGQRDPAKSLVVDVIAQQFAWLFKYPGFGNATSSTLHLPLRTYAELRAAFEAAVPMKGAPIGEVIAELAELSEPGLANMVGPRFFGWVIGATEPAGMAADWLTSAWAQNTGNALAPPASMPS